MRANPERDHDQTTDSGTARRPPLGETSVGSPMRE